MKVVLTNAQSFRLALGAGSAVVALWTVLRHISNGVNFDIVGQIGISDQWLRGLHNGAVVGQTNYLLKMPLYLAINGLHFLSPLNRLLVLALVCNVLTYVGIFLLAQKLHRLYSLQHSAWLPLALGWLAIISGNIFWLDYANSRNLETLGGVAVVYLALAYLQRPNWRQLAMFSSLASVVFFADNLQLYAIGGGIAVTCLLPALRRQRPSLQLLAATLAAALLARVLTLLASWLAPISFLQLGHRQYPLNFQTVELAAHNLIVSLATIFGANFWQAPFGPNTLRQLLNAAVLALVIGCIVAWRRSTHSGRQPGTLLLAVMTVNIAVYVASQQVLEPNTSRYLLMVPIAALLFVGLYGQALVPTKLVGRAWFGIAVASSLLLVGALMHAWPARLQNDQHVYQTVAYLQQQHYALALGNQETGITTTYFAQGQTTVLPVSCENQHTLHAITLFYDRARFADLPTTGEIPFIVAPHATSLPGVCDRARVMSILGQPKAEQIITGAGDVLLYDAATVRTHWTM